MDINTKTFCDSIRARSKENLTALQCFRQPDVVAGPALSILRQEMESFVLVLYLLSVKDIHARRRLIDSTLRGGKWTTRSASGRSRNVTDREIVGLAQKLRGWTKSAYKFGCGFLHMSEFHSRFAANPLDKLKYSEKLDILSHLRTYHAAPPAADPDIPELSRYVPRVFEQVSKNLDCYLSRLEREETLDEAGAQPGASAHRAPPRR
jgi:hypothetical protein